MGKIGLVHRFEPMKIFTYIKADRFFPKYCPTIKSYKHKIRGFNGRGNPTEFSEEEMKLIEKGLKKMFKELML
jgi:hypothetical protein